jgi:hypothetical protein
LKLAVATLILTFVGTAAAQKMDVKIIDHQDKDTDYSYVVPGQFHAQSNAQVSCYSGNCSVSSTTDGYSTPAQALPFHVRGATLALQLPDGRVAVVNCQSKFAERFAGVQGNHRDCRVPIVDDIDADFHGDKAKLEWIVSLDGRKRQS